MDELKIRTLQNDLPQELISNEILTRLPVKSLIRFKCVSKRWKSTISDPLFAKSHLQFQHSSKQSLFINNSITSFYTFDYSGYDSGQMIPSESDFDTDDDSPFDQKGVSDVELPSELACEISPSEDHYYPSFVGSCDGLVCLNPGLDNLFLWNPVTRELRKIQNPPSFPTKEEFIGGFGHVSSVDDYKIVLWSQEIDSDRQQAHVLCLKDEKWREVDVLEGYIIESRNTGALVHEIVFWCLFNKFGILCIVGFDLVAEKFVNVQVPDWIQSLENYSLSAMGGCLCVWREHRGILTIGTMKQYGDWGSWVKLHHFDTSMENVFLSMVSGFTRAGKLVIATLYGTVYLVDFSQNPPTLMTILKLSMGYDMLDYVQTLVSPFSTANVKDAVM